MAHALFQDLVVRLIRIQPSKENTHIDIMKIVIDGNIGAGKTTQLNILEKKGFHVRREPIHEWPLELFYKDMSRWALTLQLAIMQTHQPYVTEDVMIYERNLLSCRYVFWEYLKANDHVKAIEDVIHERAYNTYHWLPDVYIFLSIDPEEAYEHIKSREGQAGDSGISLEYLKEIHKLYSKLLMKVPCQVHVVKASGRTPEEIHKDISVILSLYTKDGVHVRHSRRTKMQETSSHRRPVLCAPLPDMCRLS